MPARNGGVAAARGPIEVAAKDETRREVALRRILTSDAKVIQSCCKILSFDILYDVTYNSFNIATSLLRDCETL